LLVLSACTSSVAPNSGTTVPTSASASRMTANASCQPDFSFQISPTSLTMTAGQTQSVGFGMTSICGLAGTINVGVRGISPAPTTTCKKVKGQEVCTSNGPLFHQCCYDFPLVSGGSTGNHITVTATDTTLKTTWTVTIRGEDISGGCCYGLSHSATLTLTVN
jgi:hypothetical protein